MNSKDYREHCASYNADRENNCNAMDDSFVCRGRACHFYVPKPFARLNRIDSFKRISELPYEHQLCIAEKYYAGNMPWKEEAK